MWTCPIDGKEILPRICGIKFRAARMERGEAVRTSGRKPTNSRCLKCVHGGQNIEEETKMPNIYKEGFCTICGKEGKVFNKSEKCPVCTNRRNPALIRPSHKAPAAIPTAPIDAELPPEYTNPPKAVDIPREYETRITLDLARIPDLFATLAAKAEIELRTPQDQALWILKTELGC